MRYYQVPPDKWRQYQHYGRRNPPWIKLHRDLVDDDDFCELPDHLKMQLMGIWLLASKLDNQIPDRGKLLNHYNLSKKPWDFTSLVQGGFVELVEAEVPLFQGNPQVASNALALREQLATPETETEVETETEKQRRAEVQKIYDHWRNTRAKKDVRYSRISEGRRRKIMARLREFTSEELIQAIDAVALDPWEDRPRHDDLTIIFRSQEQVDKFLAIHADKTLRTREQSVREHLASLRTG